MSEWEIGYTPNNLRKLLADSGKTQQWLADMLEVSPRTVVRWCNGKNTMQHGDWVKSMRMIEREAPE